MNERRRFLLLTLIMVAACLFTAAVTVWALYGKEIDTHRAQLLVTAESQAKLLNSFYMHEQAEFHSRMEDVDKSLIIESTIQEIRRAGEDRFAFGETGELVLARLVEDSLEFILTSSQEAGRIPVSVSLKTRLAEPMRMATAGQSGTMVGVDFAGRKVIAAYLPVETLGIGLVAKIDVAEVRSAYISICLVALAEAILIAVFGALLFRRISTPVIDRLTAGARDLKSEIERRKETEKTLRRAKSIALQAERTANLGTWYLDTRTGEVEWSDYLCELFGAVPVGLAAGVRAVLKYTHPEDRSLVLDQFRHNRYDHIEFRSISPDRGVRHYRATRGIRVLDDDGTSRIAGTVQDVTKQKEIENELRENAFWIIESQRVARLGHYVLDIRSGQWTSSEIMNSVFGIDSDYEKDVGGWTRIIHPEDRSEMIDYFQDHVIGRAQSFDRKYRIIRVDDGEERWVHGLGELTLDENGTPVKMVGTIQDVTEREKLEQERLRIERRVQQAQKIESLGVLAGGIAHDFNNLLMTILGNSDLALQSLSPHAPGRGNVEAIETAARRAAGLAQQMLAYSGKGHFVIESIDVNEFVEEMSYLLEVSVSKSAVVKYNLADNLPPVEVDATQIRQVLMNLIINASEAIGDRSGVISISTGARVCSSRDLTSTDVVPTVEEENNLEEGLYVYLEVSDTGCGMDRTTIERIFDPFFTTKFTGRGLGLAAAQGIVRGHKGVMKVKSSPGKGTTFTVLLPAGRHAADEPEGEDTTEKSRWKGEGTILLVDDEETIRVVGKQMLEKLGFSIITAADGLEALDHFREQADTIACVILDLTMPRMDGREAFREMQSIRNDVRVILCSGYSETELMDQFEGKGLSGFLQKPYQSKDLIEKLNRVLSARNPVDFRDPLLES